MRKVIEIKDIDGRTHLINTVYITQVVHSVNDLVINIIPDKVIRINMDYEELKILIHNASV